MKIQEPLILNTKGHNMDVPIAPLKKNISNSQRDCDELSLVALAVWGAAFCCSAGGAFGGGFYC